MGIFDRFMPGVVEAPRVGPEYHEPIQAGLGEVVYMGPVDRDVPGMIRVPLSKKEIPSALKGAAQVKAAL